jgi:hypothetical protein
VFAGIWADDRHPLGGRLISDPLDCAALRLAAPLALASASVTLVLWPLL